MSVSEQTTKRVTVDFPEAERELLQKLSNEDFRDRADEIRYLVMAEAARRGWVEIEEEGTMVEKYMVMFDWKLSAIIEAIHALTKRVQA